MAATVVAAATLPGCGNSPTRVYVTAAEERSLPTMQFSAGVELCPDKDLRQRDRLAIKRRAHLHVRALIRALRIHPDAFVHTTYASSDEGPGKQDITVRQLVEQWIQLSYCAPNVRDQLTAVSQRRG